MSNYRKIDIVVSPKIISAAVIQKHVCRCKMPVLQESVVVGQQYQVDIDSIRWVRWRCAGCGRVIEIRILDVYSGIAFAPITWLFIDVLDIGAIIPETKKPLNWESVKNNTVSPKGFSLRQGERGKLTA